MKKVISLLFILVYFFCFSDLKLYAVEKFELKTSESTLVIDQKRNLKIIYKNGKNLQINTSINNLWKIVLKNSLNNKEYELSPNKDVVINKSDNIIRMVMKSFSVENVGLPVEAEFTISVKDDAFCFSGTLKSNSDEWILKELNYPNITGIHFSNGNAGIYWPVGLGQYFNNPADFGTKRISYPAAMEAAMPWLSLNYLSDGIYIGSHDSFQKIKFLNLSFDESTDLFNASISTPIYCKEHTFPDVMVKPYTGEWHLASKFYRAWYDEHFNIVRPPKWVMDDSGWLLAILKQQNLEVMFPYEDIDKLCDIAEQFNLSTIGLFGWAVGGHDRYYPNFPPDNLMGGRRELERAIKRAQKRGIKIILYANGKIMDTNTDYYLYNGFETMLLKDNLQPDIQYYVKQDNSTPVIFAQACAGSDVWRRTMSDLGLQAVSLGADGILYDQLGVMSPLLCFSKDHDHNQGEADAEYRLQMITEIREKTKGLNPDFIVMTEATNDVTIRGIDYTHGWGVGLAPSPNIFPALYRYTFPELITTQRNPNPMITRTDANFAAIYGLRHEIESRYPGDVEYLLHGTLPTPESYSNVVSPPNVNKMKLLPAAEATEYVHSLIEFENDNSDFFRRGSFIDEEGIEVKGDDILSKGFVNGNRLGVVVWNQHLTEPRNFSAAVSGYRLIKAYEPEKSEVTVTSPLKPNSIRLLVFEK